jgi:hypothetical protein
MGQAAACRALLERCEGLLQPPRWLLLAGSGGFLHGSCLASCDECVERKQRHGNVALFAADVRSPLPLAAHAGCQVDDLPATAGRFVVAVEARFDAATV